MDFLGVGLPELILVLLVALIVVGPQRLPQVAVQIARTIRMMRRYATDVTADLRGEFQEITKEYDDVRQEIRQFQRTVDRETSAATGEADAALRAARAPITPLPHSPIIETTSAPTSNGAAAQEDTGQS